MKLLAYHRLGHCHQGATQQPWPGRDGPRSAIFTSVATAPPTARSF